MKKEFRQDINGLRAWAVISVILFHFGIPGFSGGFVGVDIFFVISGFLMTGIIYNGLSNGSFSIIDFYFARAKRIIPALLILCLVLLTLGWNFLPVIEYEQLGKHVFGAATFLSNIMFWQESGYFDSASHEKWLLHTWSLSVEWQFYIILPIALLLIWKISPKKNSIVLIFLFSAAASLALSIFITNWKPSAAFYLLPTRAWEMLAGGILFLLQHQITKNTTQLKLLEIIGFSFIISSIIIFDSQTLWPSWNALLPTIGTCLVIAANQKRSILSTTNIHQKVGLWSYSLYLWHWPLVVLLAFIEQKNTTEWIALGLFLTLLLGWLSFRYIESYSAKRLSQLSKANLKVTLGISVIIISFTGALIKVLDGQAGRPSQPADTISQEKNNIHPRRDECHGSKKNTSPECHYGGDKIVAMLIGDSHAASIITSIETALPNNEKGFIAWTYSSCPTLFGVDRTGHPQCKEFNSKALARSQTLPTGTPIIIVNRSSAYIVGNNEDPVRARQDYISFPNETNTYNQNFTATYVDTVCKYSENNPVFLLRPIPEMGVNIPLTMSRRSLLGNNLEVTLMFTEYLKRHNVIINAQNEAKNKCKITIIDTPKYLCNKDECNSSKDGLPLYFDDDHLSERGARLLSPVFENIFSSRLSNLMSR
jgi:peptidoglycan/LPS O-acetylase OafA/YrhL